MKVMLFERNMLALHSAIAHATGVPTRDLVGRARHREAVEARFAAFLVLRERTIADRPMSTTRIGRVFNRDHSTVIDGLKRARDLMADPAFAATYDRVKQALGT